MSLTLLQPSLNTPVPLSDFATHLRLSHGFVEDGAEDAILAMMLRAATAAIERRLGKALIKQSWRLTLDAWPAKDRASLVNFDLPLGPLICVLAVRLIPFDQPVIELDPARWRLLLADPARILFIGGRPSIPQGWSLQIDFEAGFGPDWNDVPEDLRHAVLLLASHYYERRYAVDAEPVQSIPFGISSLLEPYRIFRL